MSIICRPFLSSVPTIKIYERKLLISQQGCQQTTRLVSFIALQVESLKNFDIWTHLTSTRDLLEADFLFLAPLFLCLNVFKSFHRYQSLYWHVNKTRQTQGNCWPLVYLINTCGIKLKWFKALQINTCCMIFRFVAEFSCGHLPKLYGFIINFTNYHIKCNNL